MSTSPQWQFIGNVPENYERYLVPSIFAPWAHDLIEAAALRPGERVLDIACGYRDCGTNRGPNSRRRRECRRARSQCTHARGCALGGESRGCVRRVEGRQCGKAAVSRRHVRCRILSAGPTIFSRSTNRAARDVPNTSANWTPCSERLARNRAKPGFCRASRCVDASYNTGFL